MPMQQKKGGGFGLCNLLPDEHVDLGHTVFHSVNCGWTWAGQQASDHVQYVMWCPLKYVKASKDGYIVAICHYRLLNQSHLMKIFLYNANVFDSLNEEPTPVWEKPISDWKISQTGILPITFLPVDEDYPYPIKGLIKWAWGQGLCLLIW